MGIYVKTSAGAVSMCNIEALRNDLDSLRSYTAANVNQLVQYDKQFAYTENTQGESFQFNFLLVDTNNMRSEYNKNSFWGSEDIPNTFVNVPPNMPDYCFGIRQVFWCDYKNILVKITESVPLTGRQYFNYYNGTNWLGWKIIAPSDGTTT